MWKDWEKNFVCFNFKRVEDEVSYSYFEFFLNLVFGYAPQHEGS